MPRTRLLPVAFALTFAMADFTPAFALPVASDVVKAAAPVSAIELARFGGGRGGGMHRGGFGGVRRVGVGHRGYGIRGGGMYRGYGARRAAVGRYRVGGRYYGGIWYGTGRRFWRGRWWPYGVGSCWRWSPIGYVWVCG